MPTCRSATRSVSTSVAGTGRAHAGALADLNETIDAVRAQPSGPCSSGARLDCPDVSSASCCSVPSQVALKGWPELLLRSCYFERAGTHSPTYPPATTTIAPLARVALGAAAAIPPAAPACALARLSAGDACVDNEVEEEAASVSEEQPKWQRLRHQLALAHQRRGFLARRAYRCARCSHVLRRIRQMNRSTRATVPMPRRGSGTHSL